MKKLISILLLIVMALLISGCGSKAAQPAAPAVQQAEPTPEPTPDPALLADEAKALFAAGDYREAYEQLTQLDKDVPGVSALLGVCSYLGLGTEADAGRAVPLLTEAAEQGSVYAQYLLADAADNGRGTRQDKDEAARRYIKFIAAAEDLSADAGCYGPAMTALADCYANGKGAAALPGAARKAADKAAAAADLTPYDQMSLAALYEGTKLGEENKAKADTLYQSAAEGIQKLADTGNLRAVKLLGDLYLNGKGGLTQDYAKAMAAFLTAAEQDYAPAQAQLAYMYMNALGVEADYNEAMEWNNRAAQQGDAQAQAQIGYMYHMGLGVTQNLDEAGRWYTKAAQGGNTWAAGMLEQTEITNPHANFEAHA